MGDSEGDWLQLIHLFTLNSSNCFTVLYIRISSLSITPLLLCVCLCDKRIYLGIKYPWEQLIIKLEPGLCR